MMVWYGGDGSWLGYVGMGIGMVLFWALVIGGIVVLVRISAKANVDRPQQPASAEQILATRYARGEITESEYRDRLAVLRT